MAWAELVLFFCIILLSFQEHRPLGRKVQKKLVIGRVVVNTVFTVLSSVFTRIFHQGFLLTTRLLLFVLTSFNNTCSSCFFFCSFSVFVLERYLTWPAEVLFLEFVTDFQSYF